MASKYAQNRADLESLTRRRFFFRQGSEIYGGVAGFYTYGPPGCAVKNNLTQLWREHFVYEEQLMEIEDTCIMPHDVLKASGHVDRFNDFMVRDSLDEKRFFRADKLLEEVMEAKMQESGVSKEKIDEYKIVHAQADAYSKDELMDVFKKYEIKAPETGNDLSEPFPFNLMFPTPIGPSGMIQGYLRPETAQGIFLNYKFCLEQNANRLPFGIAQVGKSFRNEIAPRAGLTRQREFTQAEIEYFVKPTAKEHPKFVEVQDLKLSFFTANCQETAQDPKMMTVGEAVKTKTVDNETLGFFIARTALFLISAGIKKEGLRFRQHLSTEMAHYAKDCWDAEIETCYGWLECVGIADRSCFDLNAHSEATKVDLNFREMLDPPIEQEVLRLKKQAGIAAMKAFKKDGKAVKEWLETMDPSELQTLVNDVKAKGKVKRKVGDVEVELLPEHVDSEVKKEKITTNTFTPGVIEPSFGIDRILFSIFEHTYYERKDTKEKSDDKQTRGVLALPANIAPYKVSILPLDQRIARHETYAEFLANLRKSFGKLGLSYTLDESGATVGKRYSRNDELGIPFAVTVDFESIEKDSNFGTATVRERDSQDQIRLSFEDIPKLVQEICAGRKTWAAASKEYDVKKGSTSI